MSLATDILTISATWPGFGTNAPKGETQTELDFDQDAVIRPTGVAASAELPRPKVSVIFSGHWVHVFVVGRSRGQTKVC